MSQVQIEAKEDIAVLRMTNGVTNVIGVEMVRGLLKAVEEIKKEFRGMILAGNEKFFSMGLDLPGLMPLDRQDMDEFMRNYNDACFKLYTLPIPTVCALAGHAVAGGHILALTGDFRVAADEKIKLGMNEIRLGAPVPFLADMMQRQIVSDRAAGRILYFGDWMPVEEALNIGLVDEVVGKDAVEKRALQVALRLAARPSSAFVAVKSNRNEAVCGQYEKLGDEKNDVFLDCWFSPETRERLAEAAKKF